MRKLILVILSLTLILSLLLSGCASPAPAPVAAKPGAVAATVPPTLLERVATLESKQSSIEAINSKQDASILAINTNNPVSTFQTTINQNIKDIAVLQAKVDAVKAQDTSTLATKTELATLKTQIEALTTDNIALKKQVTDLTAKVNTTTTSSSGSTSTSTTPTSTAMGTAVNGQVFAQIISYGYSTDIFGSSSTAPVVLSFAPAKQTYSDNLTANPQPFDYIRIRYANTYWWMANKTTQPFQLQIQNNTGKTISNIQLSLTWILISQDDGSQITLPDEPTTISYSLSSTGNPQWTPVSGNGSYASYTTGSNNSMFGNIWNFSQNAGTQSYYSNLSVYLSRDDLTITKVMPVLKWYCVPVLKISSYNIN